MTTLLVTGATGNVGRATARTALERGATVRALVRDPDRARQLLPTGVELVVGDFTDAASLHQAVAGVDAVFLTSADTPDKVAHETAVVDAAAAGGVRRLVKLSPLGAAVGSTVGIWDWHGRIEAALMAADLDALVLRASFFMTNVLAAAEPVRIAGQLPVPAGDARIAMVHPADVGAAAAALLVDPPHHAGSTVVVHGPQLLSYADVADVLSEVTGRRVTYVDVPSEAARAAMQQAGVPEWYARDLVAIFAELLRGVDASTSDVLGQLLGREPRTFADFARQHAEAFRAAAAPALA